MFENEAERLFFEHVFKFDKNEFKRRYDLEREPCVDCPYQGLIRIRQGSICGSKQRQR